MIDERETPDLSNPAGRLAYARSAAGYSSPRAAAKAFDWNENTYKSHENGIRQAAGLKEEHARKYARAFGVSLAWLMTGRGDPKGREGRSDSSVRIIGQVGASTDGQVELLPDSLQDIVPPPPGPYREAMAFEVNGPMLQPVGEMGSVLYFGERESQIRSEMIGDVCAVETDDGRVLISKVRRGTEPSKYDLEPVLGPTIPNVGLKWAAEFLNAMRPAQAARSITRAKRSAA